MILTSIINDNKFLFSDINDNLLPLQFFSKSCNIFSWQSEKLKRAIALLPDTL